MTKSNTLKITAVSALLLLALTGCSSQETQAPAPETKGEQTAAAQGSAVPPPDAPPANPAGVVAEVDGVKLTEEKVDQDYKRMYAIAKQNMPEQAFKQEAPKFKARVVNEFIAKTLLQAEMTRRNISPSAKEVDAEIENMKRAMRPGTTLEDQLKKANVTMDQFRSDAAFGIGVSKLVKQYGGAKLKPKDKDVREFYNKNKDKFKEPETAHARHILIAASKSDDAKTRADKKAKAEDIRKKIVGGGDFAKLAAENSDCPSKSNGGDLGTFPRGQMVKPFDDVAFSLKLNETSPVVETDFGYHIIQVLERKPGSTRPLDEQTKKMIAGYLERENQINAYKSLMEELKGKAKITIYKQY